MSHIVQKQPQQTLTISQWRRFNDVSAMACQDAATKYFQQRCFRKRKEPNGIMAFIQRRINVNASSWFFIQRRVNVVVNILITKTRLLKYIENFTSKNWKFSDKKLWYFFYISAQNIDRGYSLEPPRRGGSNEYPQSLFLSRNKKNNYTPVNSSFTI